MLVCWGFSFRQTRRRRLGHHGFVGQLTGMVVGGVIREDLRLWSLLRFLWLLFHVYFLICSSTIYYWVIWFQIYILICNSYSSFCKHIISLLSLYNAYGRENAYTITFQEDPNDPTKTQAVQTTLFRWVPSITYNFKF